MSKCESQAASWAKLNPQELTLWEKEGKLVGSLKQALENKIF